MPNPLSLVSPGDTDHPERAEAPGTGDAPVRELRLRARMALAAEHLCLQKQVALYQAHHATWRCDLHATRFTLVWLSQWFAWQPALTIVHPATFKRWCRQGWRLLLTKPAKPG